MAYRGVSMAMYKLAAVQPSDAQLLIMTILRSKIRAVRFMSELQTKFKIDQTFNIISKPSCKNKVIMQSLTKTNRQKMINQLTIKV